MGRVGFFFYFLLRISTFSMFSHSFVNVRTRGNRARASVTQIWTTGGGGGVKFHNGCLFLLFRITFSLVKMASAVTDTRPRSLWTEEAACRTPNQPPHTSSSGRDRFDSARLCWGDCEHVTHLRVKRARTRGGLLSLRDVWLSPPAQDHLCWRISAHVFFVDLLMAAS